MHVNICKKNLIIYMSTLVINWTFYNNDSERFSETLKDLLLLTITTTTLRCSLTTFFCSGVENLVLRPH